MSSILSCQVCSSPAKSKFRLSSGVFFRKRFFCSQECKNSKQTDIYFNGIILVLLGIFYIFSVLLGIIIIILILLLKKHRQDIFKTNKVIREETELTNRRNPHARSVLTQQSGALDISQPRLNVKTKQLYSDILENHVDPCCYQTARLEEKYCTCGKGIVYPPISKVTKNR